MVDKSTIAKNAQMYASKGQIDKAIAEWETLLRTSPDGNIYNTVGDLYLKKKARAEAIEAFTKAANIFKENGFFLKAIALYKKILHISPLEINILVSLGELNAEKGLIGNASENFSEAAKIYLKEGLTEEALTVYEKAIQITPSDINLKLKIAELYLKIGLKEEAVKKYLSIASDYQEQGEQEKAREFYLKTIDCDHENVPAFIGIGRVAEDSGDIKQAYEYLSKALSFAFNNQDVLFHFARLAIATGNTDDAQQALTKLTELEPSNNHYKKLLGSLYLKEGAIEKAWKELSPYIDEIITLEQWDESLDLLKHFNDMDPSEVKLRLIPTFRGMNDNDSAIRELKALADIYVSKNLPEDAVRLFREVLELDPSDKEAPVKIEELENKPGIKKVPPEASLKDEAFNEIRSEALEVPDVSKEEETVSNVAFDEVFEERLAEADFYAQQGLQDEAIKLYKELLVINPNHEELRKKLGAFMPIQMPRAEEEKQHVEQPPMDSDLKDIFHEFKKGIDKELGEEDGDSRYNLGIAYKEMGLLDDAIKEFTISAKDPAKSLQSSSMLALCYMENNLYPLAIEEFNKVIKLMPPTDSSYPGVKCDLADAYVKNKEYSKALDIYNEIYARDPKFRDVERKVRIIKSMMPEEKEKPKTKKDRVSYI